MDNSTFHWEVSSISLIDIEGSSHGKRVVPLGVPGDSLMPGVALSGLRSERRVTKQIHREACVPWARAERAEEEGRCSKG